MCNCSQLLHYYYYNHFTALWVLSGTTQVSWYQKGTTKTNLNFLEQETLAFCGTSTLGKACEQSLYS